MTENTDLQSRVQAKDRELVQKVSQLWTIQRAPRMPVISVYFRLNLCKLYDGPIRLLADHDFTVRCIRGRWMV